jgi:hypothetical protein
LSFVFLILCSRIKTIKTTLFKPAYYARSNSLYLFLFYWTIRRIRYVFICIRIHTIYYFKVTRILTIYCDKKKNVLILYYVMMTLFQGFGKILNFRWFTVHHCRKSVPLGLGMKIYFCVADVTILVVNGVDAYIYTIFI